MSKPGEKKKVLNAPKTVIKAQQAKLSEDMVPTSPNLSKTRSRTPSTSMTPNGRD